MIWNKERRSNERIDTLIASDIVIRGDIEFSSGIQIDGRIEGTIKGVGEKSIVRVTSKGKVDGDIYAPIIIINGHVTGSVYSYSHLELGEEAHVVGDVHYQLMEMLIGAEVNGKMVHETLGVQEKPGVQDKRNIDLLSDVDRIAEMGKIEMDKTVDSDQDSSRSSV